MILDYALMDPAGNRTILVRTPVPERRQPGIAAGLMALEPTAEQVGFLGTSPDGLPALRMAGGEFCGNAAMSAAALHILRSGMDRGQVMVAVSGAPEPVTAEIRQLSPTRWQGAVDMPRPLSLGMADLPGVPALPLIAFPGISHIILEADMPRDRAEALVREWCGSLGADTLGLMFLDRAAGTLRPLVYVPAADTLFWESACGSGTSAVGAWMARERGARTELKLAQPGGVLEVAADPSGALRLKGTVRCLYERTASLNIQI